MAFCLRKDKAKKFLQAIKNGTLDVDKLAGMTSEQRVKEFMRLIDIDEATAKAVNALFESKLLLKYQKTGMKNWIEKTGNLKESTKRDLVSRVNRLDKALEPQDAFLEDLVAQRVGVGVTEEETAKLFELSKKVEKTKELIKDTPKGSSERLDYGMASVEAQDYFKDLKLKAEGKKIIDYLKQPKEIVYELGGIAKSLLASMDNSFFGRQGIKVLFNSPTTWVRNFKKSFGDIGKELKGLEATTPIKAEVISRPYAIDGTYKKMGLDVGIDSEEAFPSALPGRIPILGRLFKASESAYNGAALRMRADFADKTLEIAKRNGVDITNEEELKGLGNFINSMTGRGSIGVLEPASKQINVLAFSIKFLKSNIDTLTAHQFDPKATKYSKKQARKSLARIVGGLSTIYAMAYAINPDSVEFDPRSTAFGKIKVGNTYFDITGGMASLATLAMRLVPTMHEGKWGLWQKSSTGKWTDLTSGKYMQRNAEDVFFDFLAGKTAPIASIVRDYWRGRDYDGNKPTIKSSIENLTVPIPIQTYNELKWEDPLLDMAIMVGEEIGFGSYTIETKEDEKQVSTPSFLPKKK